MPPMLVRGKPWIASFSALLATFAGGCSGSDADVELVSQAQFPERFANVWCESVAACCAQAHVARDPATCQAHARELAAAQIAERVAFDTTYSAAAGTLCLGRLERALKNCELEDASSACALIFVGPAPVGTPCANGSACASGYCALGEAGLSGVCAEASYRAPVHGKAGESCVGSCGIPGSFQCPTALLPNSDGTTTYCYAEDDLYCAFDPDALDQALACRPYAAVGDRCTEISCAPGSFCADGTCLAQRASGSCAETPNLCEAQSYCDAAQQCQPKKPDGAACESGEACTHSSCSLDGQTEGVCDSGSALTARACSGAF